MEIYNDYFVNEQVVQERKEKMERIKQLANQINSENDVVKQQKTTNQFLLEMLNVQQAQYEMQMNFFYAISLNLINEKSNSKFDMKKVIDEKENFGSSKDTVKSKATDSTEKYIDNLIKSTKGNSIDDLLNGRVK